MKGLDIHFFPEIPYQNHNDTSAANRFRKNKPYYYQTNKIILTKLNSNILHLSDNERPMVWFDAVGVTIKKLKVF